jgi:uncharacterized protein YlaI
MTLGLSSTCGPQAAQLNKEAAELMLLPHYPLDDNELSKQYAFEKPAHAVYLFGFRTLVCQAWLENNCIHDAYTCFHAHARVPRRRKPLLQHGRFNYIPTRCRYVSDDKQCPQRHRSHVTEEVIYHPSKYRSALCQYNTDATGVCTGYGLHCVSFCRVKQAQLQIHCLHQYSDALFICIASF